MKTENQQIYTTERHYKVNPEVSFRVCWDAIQCRFVHKYLSTFYKTEGFFINSFLRISSSAKNCSSE